MASAELWSRRREIESARAAGRAIDPVIDGSWQRCKPLLPASRAHAPVDAEPDEVGERWEASPIRRSGIGVEAQLASAAEASDLIAAITDEEGRILWTAGSTRMRDLAAAVGFVPGGRWDEASAGTNALGLALLTGRPASVFSAEHWCQSVQDWVCWSVPVRAPDVGDYLALIGDLEHLDLLRAFHAAPVGPRVFALPVPAKGMPLPTTRRSDHAAFWDRGVGAVLVTDTAELRNPRYHLPGDTPDTLAARVLIAEHQLYSRCLAGLVGGAG